MFSFPVPEALAELCRGRTGPWPAQVLGRKKISYYASHVQLKCSPPNDQNVHVSSSLTQETHPRSTKKSTSRSRAELCLRIEKGNRGEVGGGGEGRHSSSAAPSCTGPSPIAAALQPAVKHSAARARRSFLAVLAGGPAAGATTSC
jgi:hypothetical protein